MDRPGFMRALIARVLADEGRDPRAADLVAAGLRNGRDGYVSPGGPHQRPALYYPGLRAQPFHDARDFAWVPDLEAAAPAILGECAELTRTGAFAADPAAARWTRGDWQQVPLLAEGKRYHDACLACPATVAALARVPGAGTAGLAYFSRLGPGTHVAPHCGPHNARLRCHLGLVTPDGCRMRVGDRTEGWVQGKAIIFDDSFEHEVWNDSGRDRIVLILDVWHPDLTEDQVAAIRLSETPAVVAAFDVAKELRSRD